MRDRLVIRRHLTTCAVLIGIGACGRSVSLSDPVDGIALSRQRTISRAELGFRWPLTVGVGTLACDDAGSILFRTQHITYVLSGRGTTFADIQPLRSVEPSPPPSNPLRRLTQTDRGTAFREVTRCASSTGNRDPCRRSVRQRFVLSEQELAQIEAEGHERKWPPLTRELMPLDPLIAQGRQLCAAAGG
jgi:hypothetical protein